MAIRRMAGIPAGTHQNVAKRKERERKYRMDAPAGLPASAKRNAPERMIHPPLDKSLIKPSNGIRLGLMTQTTAHYSGGRIHLYQYAVSMAMNGADVWLITDRYPKWAGDYPRVDRLHIVTDGKHPRNFDVIATDGKGGWLKRAVD